MYFEFESIPTAMESTISLPSMLPISGLNRRHRRLSSSTQSLRELIDSENCLENITPSHCDLYLITRKKLSQINANTVKQSQDLRREVLLTSIHRNITSKSPTTPKMNGFSVNELTASTPTIDSSAMTTHRDRTMPNDSQQMTINSDQNFKYVNPSATTTTSTTTMANASSTTRMITTSSVRTTPSTIKKRNLAPTPMLPNSDYEEEWKTTIKKLKVVHGLDDCAFDVSMDSEFDSGFCDNDLNDLTNNFHSLKTPFT